MNGHVTEMVRLRPGAYVPRLSSVALEVFKTGGSQEWSDVTVFPDASGISQRSKQTYLELDGSVGMVEDRGWWKKYSEYCTAREGIFADPVQTESRRSPVRF